MQLKAVTTDQLTSIKDADGNTIHWKGTKSKELPFQGYLHCQRKKNQNSNELAGLKVTLISSPDKISLEQYSLDTVVHLTWN